MPSRTKRASDSNEYEEGGGEVLLLQLAQNEVQRFGRDFTIQLKLDIQASLCIVSLLQVALRRPELPENTQEAARLFIDLIHQRFQAAGYTAFAQMIELGDNPEFDTHG